VFLTFYQRSFHLLRKKSLTTVGNETLKVDRENLSKGADDMIN
jgi:hypothetical protein